MAPFDDKDYMDRIWESDPDVVEQSINDSDTESNDDDFEQWKKRLEALRHAAKEAIEVEDNDEFGDPDKCHNKSCEYARAGDYKKACEVCEAGLKNGPNSDLYGDLMNYYSKMGRFDQVHRYLDLQITNIPKKAWTWRSFTFAIDGLIKEGAQKNAELLRALVKDYRTHLPFEEKSHMGAYDVESALGNNDQAIAALEEAVQVHPAAEQCCLKLADILIERGEFERARVNALRGISASAQSQPGIRTAYCAFLVCLCEDAMLWKDLAAGNMISDTDVVSLIDKYSSLKDSFLMKLLPYHDQIDDRISLLKLLKTHAPGDHKNADEHS